jgi:hypothetical protein
VRALVRVALAAVLLAALGAAGLGWWLSRYVAGDAFQARLRESVREATGQEPSWAALEVGVFPPRVRVEQARLGDGAGLAVERASLRVALLPLLAGAVVVDRVSVEGGVLRAVRSAEGVRWPWQGPAGSPTPVPGAAPRARGGAEASGRIAAGGFDLAVRRFELSDTRFTLEDRTITPPVELVLGEIAARARPRGDGLRFAGSARLGEGGLRGEGEIDAAGALDVTIALERLPAATFAPYLGDDARLGGALDGTLALRGPARAPDAATLDVTIGDAAFEIGDAEVRGPVSVKAELAGPLDRPAGSFALDASGAELVYGGGILRKPPGAAASAEGRIATGPDGRIDAQQVRVLMKGIGGQGALGVGGGRPLAAAFDAPPFALDGIGELVPALAPLAPEGAAAVQGLRVTTPPLALAGRIVLDGARVRPGGRGPIVLRGALVGEGAGLRSEGLVAEAGGQPAALELAVSGLDGAPRHRTRIAL